MLTLLAFLNPKMGLIKPRGERGRFVETMFVFILEVQIIVTTFALVLYTVLGVRMNILVTISVYALLFHVAVQMYRAGLNRRSVTDASNELPRRRQSYYLSLYEQSIQKSEEEKPVRDMAHTLDQPATQLAEVASPAVKVTNNRRDLRHGREDG